MGFMENSAAHDFFDNGGLLVGIVLHMPPLAARQPSLGAGVAVAIVAVAPQPVPEGQHGGWLHTGDMGAFDKEGFLTLKDRSKDLIISGGSNIYPREVEEVLLRHPGVFEVSVIGRPHADWGEEVVACVVPRPEQKISAEDLDTLCLSAIARFKRPHDYVFLEVLPKNNYGKVLKTELRKLHGQAANKTNT